MASDQSDIEDFAIDEESDLDEEDLGDEQEDELDEETTDQDIDEDQEQPDLGHDDEESDGQVLMNSSNDVQAAIDVRNQLQIWNSLLEWRIVLQKALAAANRLPQPGQFDQITKSSANIQQTSEQTSVAMMSTLESLVTLEKKLIEQNSNLAGDVRGKSGAGADIDDDEEIPSEDEEEKDEADEIDSTDETTRKMKKVRLSDRDDLEEHHQERIKRLRSLRDDVLDKWYHKTRYTGGKNSASLEAFEMPPNKVIDQILSNKDRLIKRTQLKRSTYESLGKQSDPNDEQDNSEHDPEIFDDDDFYHQLLRDVIEDRSTGDTDNPFEMSRKWIEIQRIRSKIKRKVDTRASKARKIRFEKVIKPLIGFMAKQPTPGINEEEVDQLFNSLFGQRVAA